MAEVIDPRNADDYGGYEYFKKLAAQGELQQPIRVVLDEKGRRMGADTIDAHNATLVKAAGLLGQVDEGTYIEPSNEEEFWKLCLLHADAFARNNQQT